MVRNPEFLTYKQGPQRIWGLEGLLENVWSHMFLRDGETEARVGHDVPRIREQKRQYRFPGPQLPGQEALHRASHPPHLSGVL